MARELTSKDVVLKLLSLLSSYDTYIVERRRTSKFRRNWRADGPLKCALCNISEPEAPVDAAHIRALEENGTTESANLVPLCSTAVGGHRRNAGFAFQRLLDQYETIDVVFGAAAAQNGIRIGCHELLDYGIIPKIAISVPAERVIARRTEALAKPLSVLDGEFGVRGKGAKVAKARRDVAAAVDSDAKAVAECALISRLRRTSRGGVLEAVDRSNRLEGLVKSGGMSKCTESRVYYELALVAQVAVPQRRLEITRAYLLSSRSAADPKSGSWGMSELALVQTELFAATTQATIANLSRWLQRQDVALRRINKDPNLGAHHKARWRMNCLMHRAQLFAKAALADSSRYLKKARDALEAAWTYRNSTTVEGGWMRFQSVHLVTIEGIVLHLEGWDKKALECLARALRPMVTGRGKRPEGIKDVGRCVARCFRRLHKTRLSAIASRLVKRALDQRSGIL